MSRVVISMESDQVTMQDTKQQLIAHGENSVDLATRERSVEEKADLDVLLAVADLLAEHLRQKHQVVVVNPDQVTISDFLGNCFGKEAVCFFISFPCRLVKRDFTWVVVE